jgi:PAS domain S-box-containing protein
MFRKYKQVLSPLISEDDFKDRQALHFLTLSLIVIPLLVVGQWIIRLLERDGDQLVMWPGFITMLATFAVWLIMRRGYVRLGSHLWVLALWLLATLVSARNGGVNTAVFSLHVIPILLAGLLLNPRAAVFYAVLSILSGFVMFLGAEQGWLDHAAQAYAINDPLVRWLFNTVMFLLSALILCQSTHNMNSVLKRAEANAHAQEKAEALLAAAIDQSPAGIIIADAPDGRIRLANQAALAIRGELSNHLTGIPVELYSVRWQIYHLDGLTLYESDQLPLARAILNGETVRDEAMIIRQANGENRWVMVNAAPILDGQGQIQAGIAIFPDVTAFHQTQEILQQYTTRLEILHDIDRAILRAETPATIAAGSLAHLHALIPAKRFSVTLFDTTTHTVEILATHSGGETRLGTGVHVPLNPEDWPGLDDLHQDRLYFQSDLQTRQVSSPLLRQLQTEGIQAIINAPLLVENLLIGSLNVGFDTAAVFENRTAKILQEVADQLAIAIRQAQLSDQTRHHANELEQRVAERTAELTRANERLQELDQAKSNFVSDVSHELRTPITNLKLRQHLLKIQPESADKHLEVLARETSRLESMIENLLLLSRLDQNRVEFTLEAVDLNQIVAEYACDREALAESRQLIITCHSILDLPPVQADRRLIEQVIGILITNALAYTPAGGQIVISAHRREGWAGFSVRDNGPGIPLDEQPRLFTRFFRGAAGRSSGVAGTGLGLAIAKEIVDRHDGEISIESDGIPGQGATFWVWLPTNKSA